MRTTPFTLGVFGSGCVGQGFLELLNADDRPAATVKHVCVKDRARPRDGYDPRLTYNAIDILGDGEVRAIVELTNDPVLARDVIRQALTTGRSAITASKKVVAEYLSEWIALQRATGNALLYEGSCAASIPVLRALETHFSGERVQRIEAVLNGTTNYILTQVQEVGCSPEEALVAAQRAGFAEADPSSDLSGADTRYKLVILLAHAFGSVVRPSDILCHGIEGLSAEDMAFGTEQGWCVRLLASAHAGPEGLVAYVMPTFVPRSHPFTLVRNEYNAVIIEGERTGGHLLQGKGAGRLPTGLAVLSDVQELVRGGGYAYAKVDARAPRLSRGQERIAVYARIPSTHQEVLARFDQLRTIDRTDEAVRVTGRIALKDLGEVLGNGREGFQVIALPHLSPNS